MAKTTLAPFIQKGFNVNAVAIAATTLQTGLNSILLATGGPEGSIVYNLSAMPRATYGGGALVLYTSDDGGNTKNLKDSEAMPAYTASTTSAVTDTIFPKYTKDDPIFLNPNQRLYVGILVALAAGIQFDATQGDY